MHLEIRQSTDRTETVNAAVIDKLYRLSFEDLANGITSQLDSTSDVQGRIESSAAYEDAVRYLAGIDPGDTKKFQNLYITIPNNNYYVRFKDPIVEAYCIQLYGDGVGVTKSAAAGVTTRAQMWASDGTNGMPSDLKNQVTSLNDFQYFTGYTQTSEPPVRGFNNATEIKFPSCTFSYTNRFSVSLVLDCPNLQTIDYSNCVFTVPDGNNEGQIGVVNGNNSIQEWNNSLLPNQRAFRRIQLFTGWKKLQKIIFPEGVTITAEYLKGCESIQYVEYPTTITDIGSAWDFGRDAKHRVPCVVIKATTPPSWEGWNPSNTGATGLGFGWNNFPLAIYVPDNSVTAYKSIQAGNTDNEQAWASTYIQDLIKPMSEMPQLYRDMGTVTQADIDRV